MDRDLEDELRLHLELAAADEARRAGPPAQAARAAAIRQGGMAQAMEALRDQRSLPCLEDLKRDVGYAVRGLARNPGFTAVAVLILALGIRANTAIFTLVDTVLLKRLPVRDPYQLAALTNPTVGGAAGGLVLGKRAHVSFDEYITLRDRTESFSGMLAVQAWTATQRGSVNGQSPEVVKTKLVSGGYFTLLGVPAYAGRTFTAHDEQGAGTAPYRPDTRRSAHAYGGVGDRDGRCRARRLSARAPGINDRAAGCPPKRLASRLCRARSSRTSTLKLRRTSAARTTGGSRRSNRPPRSWRPAELPAGELSVIFA